MASGFPIDPLEFLRILFRNLRRGGLQRILTTGAGTFIAAKLVIPWLRTAGFFYNRFLQAERLTPAQRLALGTTFGFPAGINPFLFTFLSGFAYQTSEQVVEGWLSSFGEIAFRDIPGVESDLEDALRAGTRRNYRAVLDAVANFYSEELGISDAAAIIRGIGAAAEDFEKLIGVAIPVNSIAGWIIWLDRAVRGIFDPLPLPPPPPTPEVEQFGQPLPLDPGLRPPFDPKTAKELPAAVKRLTMKIISPRRSLGAVLFEIGEAVTQGAKDKLRRLILRGGGL